jgi:hypothetical protein
MLDDSMCFKVAPLTKTEMDGILAAADHAITTARRVRAEVQRRLEASRKATEQLDTEREHRRERETKRRKDFK